MSRHFSIVLVLCAMLAWVGAAHADTRLSRAAPAVGAIVKTTPTEIRLRFSEGIQAAMSQVSLTDAHSGDVPLAAVKLGNDQRSLVASVTGPITAGLYRVVWRVTSVNGDLARGDFTFTIKP